jgi:anti-anti-sigma factor
MATIEEPEAEQPKRTEAGRLGAWTDHQGSRCALVLHGDLVAETIADMEEHVDLLVCCQSEEVVIDLTLLRQIDLTGARMLMGLRHYVRARGGRFNVVGADRRVQAMLREALEDLAN